MSDEQGQGDPTWEGEISEFFTQLEIGCMRSAGRYDPPFDLASFECVAARAIGIHDAVKSGYMPRGGPRWSEGKVARFDEWILAGCPRDAAELKRIRAARGKEGASR